MDPERLGIPRKDKEQDMFKRTVLFCVVGILFGLVLMAGGFYYLFCVLTQQL